MQPIRPVIFDESARSSRSGNVIVLTAVMLVLIFGGLAFLGRIKQEVFPSYETDLIAIDVLNLHHGRGRRPPVQNLGFIVHIGGRRVLHIGDTEAVTRDFAPLRLGSEPVDLALLPGWFLTSWDGSSPDWVSVVRNEIRPRNVAAMHLASPSAPANYFGSDGSLERRVAAIRTNFPGAAIFTRPLQQRTY